MQPADPVIRLENIGKCYRIFAHPQDRFKQALRERFNRFLGKQHHPPLYREHWALRDVSFEIAPGEAVGILGRNGAGKSTLLQIIAGTLAPTTGEVETAGRITALLELGSGFNPEFTGRENVFHNAQILGLSREETVNKFDNIASFADIGDFVDQPVKTYSSGMMMRLAFAVQTAVEPKILIVDEALSVGDMFFQAKCMARINKLVDEGVTLLFVSHDISTMRQICSRGILVDHGYVAAIGDIASTTDKYASVARKSAGVDVSTKTPQHNEKAGSTKQDQEQEAASYLEGKEQFEQTASYNRVSNGDAEVINLQTLKEKKLSTEFEFDDEVTVRMAVRFNTEIDRLFVGIKLRTIQGTGVLHFDSRLQEVECAVYRPDDIYVYEWTFNAPILHGKYIISCTLAHPPEPPDRDWVFIDDLPYAANLSMSPRSGGPIDAFVSLPGRVKTQRVYPIQPA